MEGGEGGAHGFAQDAEQWGPPRIDRNHIHACLPKRCRDFRTNEPHADDYRPATGPHLGSNTIGVVNRAKAVDAFELSAWRREDPVTRARRKEQAVEWDSPLVLELHDPLCRVDPRHSCPEHHLDPMFFVERGRSDQRLLEWRITAQVGLGQRRAFVRRFAFGADHDDGAVRSFVAKRHGGGRSGEARADDHVRLGHQISICSASPSMRVRNTLSGISAGGASTLPVRTSNSEL